MRVGVWYYYTDKELHIIHAFRDCTGLKMARKYNFIDEVKLHDEGDARLLDDLVEQGYYCCATCYNREQRLAALDKRRPRPGFLHPPKNYKKPERRKPVSHKKRPTTKE